MPTLEHEIAFGRNSGRIICGIDEVGRGCLAGSVIAAAAIIPAEGLPDSLLDKIKDSKKLSAKQREMLFPTLTELCPHAIAEASIAEIAEHNILHASLLAMAKAAHALTLTPHHALIDGNKLPKDLPCPATAIISGDNISLSIAVASIIAKVTRDRIMKNLATQHPEYGWERNAGYGTKHHLEALEKYGVTEWHRDSFAPVRKRIGTRF